MKISVLKEREKNENRVALTPDIASKLSKMGFEVCIESEAGMKAGYVDSAYVKAGANISKIPLEIIADADVVLKIQPTTSTDSDFNELEFIKENAIIIGMLDPFENGELISKYAQKKIKSFSSEFIPRISRAQSMDVLSSQSNLAGYRAAIEAVSESNTASPMLMTAAGSIAPSKALILGAGVAGLQAIATAKRMGCIVSAFDVRAAAKEQVMSLGAKFIEVPIEENMETEGGYARQTTEEYKILQEKLIADIIKQQDIVITTALIPGKPAPELVNADMVKSMKAGSVIVDMATKKGGNVAMSKMDEIITTENGVKIIGHSNLAAKVAFDASKLYANNMMNFIKLLIDDSGKLIINMEDEIIASSILTNDGMVINENLK